MSPSLHSFLPESALESFHASCFSQLASDANFPSVLMEVLGALLRRLREGEQDISMSSSLVLARCLIRLTVKQLEGNHSEQSVFALL